MFNINVLVAFNWVQIQDNAGQGTHSNDVKEVEQKQLINQKGAICKNWLPVRFILITNEGQHITK